MGPESNIKISSQLFYSCLWICSGLSICFTALRLGIRWKLFQRLFWDDACVLFATLGLLGTSIAWSVNGAGLFIAYDVATGKLPPTPDRIDQMLQAVRIQLAALTLFITGLWAIKLGFLLFFRRIGARVQGYKIWWWWTAVVFVVITYIISMALIPYHCMAGTVDYILAHCTGISAVNFYYAVFYINAAFDIFTDLMLISMPVLFLWDVQIPLRQKLALMGLFSLTLCIMAVAIVRVAVNGKQNGTNQDTAWIAFWAVIEIAIAIIVACLGSFRQLFTKSSGSGRGSSGNTESRMMSSFRERFANASSPWRHGHSKTSSHMALMRDDIAYSPQSIEFNRSELKQAEIEVTRTDMPLKRASQAHIAHYSAAPTERRYLVVHPEESTEHGTSVPKNGFF